MGDKNGMFRKNQTRKSRIQANSKGFDMLNLKTALKFACIEMKKTSVYRGPEIPCLRIIKKCINMNTAVNNGKTNVCKL